MNSPRTSIFFVPDENILLTLLWFRPNIRLKQAKQPTTEQDEMSSTSNSGNFNVRIIDVKTGQNAVVANYDTEKKAKAAVTRRNKQWGRDIHHMEISQV